MSEFLRREIAALRAMLGLSPSDDHSPDVPDPRPDEERKYEEDEAEPPERSPSSE